MASLFGFGSNVDVQIAFDTKDPETGENRPTRSVTDNATRTSKELTIYQGKEDICGTVKVSTNSPSVEHIGIKVELVGCIELSFGSGQKHEFISLVRELAPPGILSGKKAYQFEFKKVDKQYESYKGTQGYVRYFVRATVTRSGFGQTVAKERDFWIQNLQEAPEINSSIKMEVGIEECLHIEFEYNRSKYHLNDILLGKIYFLLVKIKIKHMEIAIIRRESTLTGGNSQQTESTTMKPTYEIMDGCPVRGEAIPVRLFLSQYDLSPTYKDVHNKMFSVRYFVNLVLIDMEDRRYFKQQEIILWRDEIG
eukprot:g1087.t1